MNKRFQTIVVKIGTRVLTNRDNRLDESFMKDLTDQVSGAMAKGVKVILVSSGAISAGMGMLDLKKRPLSLSELQATAAIGQNQLMNLYNKYFMKKGHLAAQILLTQEDFDSRHRYLNIKYTIKTLLKHGVVPIVNENDTVSTDEIKCGDNDRLSSLVADLAEADALVILTDVDGLYDDKGSLVKEAEEGPEKLLSYVYRKGCPLSTGGMSTKIEAACNANKSGIECFIVNGRAGSVVSRLLEGESIGTHFKAKPSRMGAKKRWIAVSSKEKGVIIVDNGAKEALVRKGKSLLSGGITGIKGKFESGDVISIADKANNKFARGLTNYSSSEIEKIKGLKTGQIEGALGYKDHDEVVHRDNLVIL